MLLSARYGHSFWRKGWVLTLPLMALLMVGCVPQEQDFEATDLVGKWVSGTEYYRYDADLTGATWDTADDVSESEAQSFTWSLEGAQLTVIHQMEMGGVVPKLYTLTDLTSNTLKYKDSYGQSFTFTRVQ